MDKRENFTEEDAKKFEKVAETWLVEISLKMEENEIRMKSLERIIENYTAQIQVIEEQNDLYNEMALNYMGDLLDSGYTVKDEIMDKFNYDPTY